MILPTMSHVYTSALYSLRVGWAPNKIGGNLAIPYSTAVHKFGTSTELPLQGSARAAESKRQPIDTVVVPFEVLSD
jgi:hypothetical protein